MNIITLNVKGREYLIKDMMATRLTKKQFDDIQQSSDGKFDGWKFVPNDETDSSWWKRIDKKLTKRHIYSGLSFECDFWGNITEA